ncbi:MAG: macro domain-containing protein [Sandaracinaceae bacterium]
MIEPSQGDILRADAEALVNTVNCVGHMGRGIAAQFKRAFPANFKQYRAACDRGEVEPGRMFITETGELTGPRYVVNFPTKRHWRANSRIEDIDAGLAALIEDVRRLGIRSIAVPPLGCGLGGLAWSDVRPRIEAAFTAVPEVRVLLYGPDGAPPAERMARSPEPPKMTQGRAILIALMHRYLQGVMDPWVSLLEVHKLMYFAQESGEPLNLRYKKAPYGPYAENLRFVLATIEGHFIHGYADGGDDPDKPLEILPGALADATAALGPHDATRARFDRVADLVDGFETPSGMELLATVHWVARDQPTANLDALVEQVHAWNDRKRMFSPSQIEIAHDVLRAKGWLPAAATKDVAPADARSTERA